MKIVVRMLLFMAILCSAGSPRAAVSSFVPGMVGDDTDLFLHNPLIPTGLPNVLIIWDTTANWGQTINTPQLDASGNPVLDAKGNPVMVATKAHDLEKKALQAVIANLKTADNGARGKFNVGLMLFTETGGGNSNIRGTYPRYAFKEMNDTNKAELAALISKLDEGNDRGSNAQYAKAMHEAQLWFGGNKPLAGFGQVKKDMLAFDSLGNYKSPVSDACQKNFIIMISNGTTDSGENNEAQKLLSGKGLNGVRSPGDPIPLSPNGEQSNWFDEYARTLAGGFLDVTGKKTYKANTYTIAVFDKEKGDPKTGTNPVRGQIALAQSGATKGEGRYFAGTNLDEIQKAFEDTFTLINDVDGVFASTTLPVSVNVRGTQLNQLYMGVFRPDAGMRPRWPGNLKMYKLALQSGSVILADSTGKRADDATSGFIAQDAISHWTKPSDFWFFKPVGLSGISDSPDGPLVERGAVAQGLRETYKDSQSARKIFTCTGSCGPDTALQVSDLNTVFATTNTNIKETDLGPSVTTTERTEIINWIRGEDNKENENQDANADGTPKITDARASIHGDVLHSRPAVINYNRVAGDNDVYAFYGSNDGIIHAIKGAFGSGAGAEVWGFIPSEFFGRLKTLRDNLAPVIPATGLTPARPYFADGPIGTYQKDNGDGKLIAGTDTVYLFIGMRRGGRFIYALDVSDPDAPRMLWKKTNNDPGFSELGYTWSEPKIARLVGRSEPVLIMAAGYDPNQDKDAPGADAMGRGIMVLDYKTGDLLWQAGPKTGQDPLVYGEVSGMVYSIPSDVTLLDRNGDGTIDRLYVGDTGGNLWRVDVDGGNFAGWKVTKLAAINGGTATSNRKFFFPPDVVFNPGVSPEFDSVLIGSGDREKPFDITVENRFYMFKDPDTDLTSTVTSPITELDLFDATPNTIQTGDAVAVKALKDSKGWLLKFVNTDTSTGAQTLRAGEKVISGSVTVAGTTFFNTNEPNSSSGTQCSVLGTARQYAVNFFDATATIDFITSDGGLTTHDRSVNYGTGYLPSPVSVVTQLGPKNELYQVVVAGSKVTVPTQATLEARFRTYWYMRTD